MVDIKVKRVDNFESKLTLREKIKERQQGHACMASREGKT
jgi:hypothetical protein